MFQRYISIDWSGAGHENQGVNLRVAQATGEDLVGEIAMAPGAIQGQRSWSRSRCRDWLVDALHPDKPPCLVAIDFGFGLPWGADGAVFNCKGWGPRIKKIAELYVESGTARAMALTLNQGFNGHGPYRFNENRRDYRFYLDKNVAYYRLAEVAIPQALSQWYLGAGGTVGFHTITGLAMLHELISRRNRGEITFEVWPHECESPKKGRHVLAESYPAMCPPLDDYGPCRGDHERDSWRVLQWMVSAARNNRLENAFEIRPKPFGRIEGVAFADQIRFEGWILGVADGV